MKNQDDDDHKYLCNTLIGFSKIVGVVPMVREAALVYPGLRLTALEVDKVNKVTVVFAGTEDGRIKKVRQSSHDVDSRGCRQKITGNCSEKVQNWCHLCPTHEFYIAQELG